MEIEGKFTTVGTYSVAAIVPSAIKKALKIKAGDKFIMTVEDETICIRKGKK